MQVPEKAREGAGLAGAAVVVGSHQHDCLELNSGLCKNSVPLLQPSKSRSFKWQISFHGAPYGSLASHISAWFVCWHSFPVPSGSRKDYIDHC